jgi:hypothetical protein
MGKRILTAELLATVPALLEQGLGRAEIAEQFGCTPGTLTVKCSIAKISLRRSGPRQRKQPTLPPVEVPLAISSKAMERLCKRAAVKGCSETTLASNLLETIARDDLYDAVLDES